MRHASHAAYKCNPDIQKQALTVNMTVIMVFPMQQQHQNCIPPKSTSETFGILVPIFIQTFSNAVSQVKSHTMYFSKERKEKSRKMDTVV